ncbi:MAG: AAA family ATPase [Candidatus Helarchaeota archaeon]
MNLSRLYLKNFRSYEEENIDFFDGYNIILGPNGSGKTTIFLAIIFALFGGAKKDGVEIILKDFVRHGEEECIVSLEFIVAGDTYKVVRRINAVKKRSYAKLYKDSEVISEKPNTVTTDIESIINIDRKTFENIIYISQGEITKISSETPSERKKLFDKFLGLDTYEWVYKNLREVNKHFENELQLKKEEFNINKTHLKVLPERKEELNKYIKYLKTLKSEKSKIEKELEEKDTKFKKLDSLKQEIDLLTYDLKNIKSNLDKITLQIESDSKNIEKNLKNAPKEEIYRIRFDKKGLENKNSELKRSKKKLISDITILQGIIDFQKELEIEIEQRETQIKLKKDKLTEVSNEIADTTEMIKKQIPELDKYKEQEWKKLIDNQLAQLNDEIQTLSEKKDHIIEMEQELNLKKQIIKERTEKLANNNQKVKQLKSKIKKIYEDWENLIKEFKQEDLELEIEKLTKNIEIENKILYESNAKKEAKKDKLNEIKSEMEKVKNLKEDATCPTCKQTVSGDHKKNILEELQRTYDIIENEINDIEKIITEKNNILKDLNNNLSNKSNLLKKLQKIIPLSNELQSCNKDLAELEAEIDKYNKDISEISITESSAELKHKIDILSNKYNQIDSNKIKIMRIEDKRHEITELKSGIEKLQKEIDDKKKEYSYDELEQCMNEFSSKSKEIDIITNIIPMIENLIFKINEKDETSLKLNTIQDQFNTLSKKFDTDLYNELVNVITELNKELNEKTGSINEIENKLIPSVKKEINRLNILQNRIKELEDEINHIQRQLMLVQLLRDFYRKIPPILRKYQTQKISEYATELLKLMLSTGRFERIIVKNNYELRVTRFGIEEDISQLSGGEQVIICLAIRLAISDVLASRELILLDEPTTHLDDENIKHLVDIFYQFRPSAQMITVTHDSEFEKIADHLFNVEKEDEIRSIIVY